MHSEDIKIFGKNDKELCIEKCAMSKKKSRKREIMEGIELPDQESIRTLGEKENYTYLGILNVASFKEMKEK